MEQGLKFDNEKNRLDLVPTELVFAVGHILTFGANKYGDRNWEGGIKYSRIYAAILRHLLTWFGGEDTDKESGMSHLWHAATNIAFLIAFEQRKHRWLDDRPNAQNENNTSN